MALNWDFYFLGQSSNVTYKIGKHFYNKNTRTHKHKHTHYKTTPSKRTFSPPLPRPLCPNILSSPLWRLLPRSRPLPQSRCCSLWPPRLLLSDRVAHEATVSLMRTSRPGRRRCPAQACRTRTAWAWRLASKPHRLEWLLWGPAA